MNFHWALDWSQLAHSFLQPENTGRFSLRVWSSFALSLSLSPFCVTGKFLIGVHLRLPFTLPGLLTLSQVLWQQFQQSLLCPFISPSRDRLLAVPKNYSQLAWATIWGRGPKFCPGEHLKRKRKKTSDSQNSWRTQIAALKCFGTRVWYFQLVLKKRNFWSRKKILLMSQSEFQVQEYWPVQVWKVTFSKHPGRRKELFWQARQRDVPARYFSQKTFFSRFMDSENWSFQFTWSTKDAVSNCHPNLF